VTVISKIFFYVIPQMLFTLLAGNYVEILIVPPMQISVISESETQKTKRLTAFRYLLLSHEPCFLFVLFYQELDRNLDFPFYDLPCLQSRFLSENTAKAEAYIVVGIRGIVVVPIGNGAVVGIVVPATAAFHPVVTAF
jgi:hypothetical protein